MGNTVGKTHQMLASGILADVTASYAWGGFIWLVLGLCCACIGAVVGARMQTEMVDPTPTTPEP